MTTSRTGVRQQVAREGLLRTTGFTLERAEAGGEEPGDGLTLSGHAATFNVRTTINSWEGAFEEEIAPGAFRKTFREKTPVLQFDHGHHPLVGSIPIGKITRAEEDDTGAYVEARLHDNWLTQPVRDAIESESVTGMSFRFTVVREEWRDAKGKVVKDDDELLRLLYYPEDHADRTPLVRTLRELKVPELGPVVFPAYDSTDVGVRSGTAVIDLAQLRQDPAERRRLARALWLAEEPSHDTEDVPDSAPARSGHPEPDDDAPPAVGHPSEPTTNPSERNAAEILGRMEIALARVRKD